MPARWNSGVADTFKDRYQELFEKIGTGAVQRERDHELPHEQLAWLVESGFSALLVPAEFGGGGARHSESLELLAELARHDPHLAHIFRTQLSTIDTALLDQTSPESPQTLAGIVAGDFYGAAILERSSAAVGTLETRVARDGDGWRLNGRKYYSTSTLYANRITVLAQLDHEHDHGEEAELVSVVVPADAPGVERIDDWAGFGQQLTASGTTVFHDVALPGDAVRPNRGEEDLGGHTGALLQVILLAVIDGITRNAVDDAVAYVAARNRTFSNAAASSPREDPIVQETVGDLIGRAYAVASARHRASEALDRSFAAARSGDPRRAAVAAQEAQVEAAAAQLVVVPNGLAVATELFDVGGASTVDRDRAFDRHWRNVRTIATHNPHRNKARLLGDVHLNGSALENNFLAGRSGDSGPGGS